MSLPSNFHDETQFQARVRISTAECINNIQFLVRKFFSCQFFNGFPAFFVYRFVVVFIFVRSPPYCIFAGSIFNEEFIFRRTTGVNTCHYVYSAQFSYLTFFKAFQTRFCFFGEQNIIRRVVHNLSSTGNTVLA